MEKETAVVSMPHGFVLVTTELEERRKKNIIHYKVQHARTLKWVHNERNEHDFPLIKIHLRTMLKNNLTCFRATIVIQSN